MIAKILKEDGYDEAMLGLSLSYDVTDMARMPNVAKKLAAKDTGENKFLESICVWLDVTGPRNWWSQMDTYRSGITKQSASTMHTILRRPLTQKDFNTDIPMYTLTHLNDLIADKDWKKVKDQLPEGFLQRRVICTNYKVLRHICQQRASHRLVAWVEFMDVLKDRLVYPEFLV